MDDDDDDDDVFADFFGPVFLLIELFPVLFFTTLGDLGGGIINLDVFPGGSST